MELRGYIEYKIQKEDVINMLNIKIRKLIRIKELQRIIKDLRAHIMYEIQIYSLKENVDKIIEETKRKNNQNSSRININNGNKYRNKNKRRKKNNK